MAKPGPTDPLTSEIEAWLAAIVASSDDAIVGKTLDGIIRSWNAAASRVFGYTGPEIIGRSILTLIPPELHPEEARVLQRLSQGERFDHFETVRVRKDGSRIDISLSVSPIRDSTGRIIGAAKIARDITESKRLQRVERDLSERVQKQAIELQQQVEEGQILQEQLEQTNDQLGEALSAAEDARRSAEEANRSKGQFLAMMSHELRTPLNAISGYVELLELGIRGPLTDLQRDDLARIRHNEETLLHLVEDVLSFAKIESGRLEYRFADVLLDEVLATLEASVAPRLHKKGLSYHLEGCGPDFVIRTDRDKLEQVMLNLLSNAVKFTDRGAIEVRCIATDSVVRIAVGDTGRGIATHLQHAIFEPFVQGEHPLTRATEGTGLGLAISRQLARGLGGDLMVESATGVGSTFTLILPRIASPRPSPG
jgi:PAS domain S-box-containing protein